MGRHQKMAFSRFQRLKRQLQYQLKNPFPSRSKSLPDLPTTASESERTRRSTAPSPEVSPNKDTMSQKGDNRHLGQVAICRERVLMQTQTKLIFSFRACEKSNELGGSIINEQDPEGGHFRAKHATVTRERK